MCIHMHAGTHLVDTAAKCLYKRFFLAMLSYYSVTVVNALTWSQLSLGYSVIVKSTVICIPSTKLTNSSSNLLQHWNSEPIYILLVVSRPRQQHICIYDFSLPILFKIVFTKYFFSTQSACSSHSFNWTRPAFVKVIRVVGGTFEFIIERGITDFLNIILRKKPNI